MLVHSHPSRSALASLPKGQPRHFLTFLFEAPPEITSDSGRGHRDASTGQGAVEGERERERREADGRGERESRFLCAGKRPSVLLWFQLLCPSVNRVISHGPRCTHDIRSSSTWGPVPSARPPGPGRRQILHRRCCLRPFFISTDRYFPHGTECLRPCVRYSSATS